MARARLYLVTPLEIDLSTFPAALDAALGGGDVACLLIASETKDGADRQAVAERLAPIAQATEAAALVLDDSRAAGLSKADGVHIESGLAALKEAVASLRPKRIVGAGGLHSRHDAMIAGETGADYLFFGRLDRLEEHEPDARALALAAWWADVMQPPCVVLAGAGLASVSAAAQTGAEFVALRAAVWTHAAGPGAAVAAANRLLSEAAAQHG